MNGVGLDTAIDRAVEGADVDIVWANSRERDVRLGESMRFVSILLRLIGGGGRGADELDMERQLFVRVVAGGGDLEGNLADGEWGERGNGCGARLAAFAAAFDLGVVDPIAGGVDDGDGCPDPAGLRIARDKRGERVVF